MTGRDRAGKIHFQPHKRRSQIAVNFQLEPAITAQLRFPPAINCVQCKPWQTARIDDARRVTITPCHIDFMTNCAKGTRVHLNRFRHDSVQLHAGVRRKIEPCAALACTRETSFFFLGGILSVSDAQHSLYDF